MQSYQSSKRFDRCATERRSRSACPTPSHMRSHLKYISTCATAPYNNGAWECCVIHLIVKVPRMERQSWALDPAFSSHIMMVAQGVRLPVHNWVISSLDVPRWYTSFRVYYSNSSSSFEAEAVSPSPGEGRNERSPGDDLFPTTPSRESMRCFVFILCVFISRSSESYLKTWHGQGMELTAGKCLRAHYIHSMPNRFNWERCYYQFNCHSMI